MTTSRHSPTWSHVLLDIEGTTSSISFVFDVMFPFVRRELHDFLEQQGDQAEVRAALEQLARDAGAPSLAAWEAFVPEGRSASADRWQLIMAHVERAMDADLKTTGLKQLQGLIWKAGFASGELRAHLFDDVAPALRACHARGIDVRIYSSGSIAAQRLFFGHSVAGDLLPFLRGHYDTTSGPKREANSYRRIVADIGVAPTAVVFVSDVVAELDAAREAGLATRWAVRPGNPPDANQQGHAIIHDFRSLLPDDASVASSR